MEYHSAAMGKLMTCFRALLLLIPLLMLSSSQGNAWWHGSASVAVCPDNDGSSGATVGTAQYPTLLNGYAAAINGLHGLGCRVPGVDYRVGLIASPSLSDPTAGGLPAGATYSSGAHTVTIASNNVTFTGWDMTVAGGLELQVNSGVTGTIITSNKFQVQSPNCLSPLRFNGLAGTTTVQYNKIDGGGAACEGLTGGLTADVYIVTAASGAIFTFQWNDQENVSSDGINISGPASGTPMTFTYKYNLMYQVGWVGNPLDPNHPDGLQFAGGNVTAPVMSHNTFYNPVFVGGTAGVQPFHVEAQLTAAIVNAVVAYNEILTPGICNGGTDYPNGCSANFDIACKNDTNPPSETDSNTGFSAYGNYVVWTGAIAALTTEAGCTGATWGSPYSNYDMTTGTTLTTSP